MSKRRRTVPPAGAGPAPGRSESRGPGPSPAASASAIPASRRADAVPEIQAPATPPAAWLAAALVGLVALVLYLVTLSPTVATGDSGELTTAAARLWIAHPPGYPTFTILGHLFTLLPIGDAAFRVNLMSAVLDAIAIAVLVLVTGRLIEVARISAPVTRGPAGNPRARAAVRKAVAEPEAPRLPWLPWLAAAAGGLSLAVSTAFWRYSLSAEVFPLNNLLALVLLLLMLEWSRRPTSMRLLWVAALLGGVALTNQQTIVFVAPALLVLLGVGIQRYTEPPAGRRVGRPVPWRAVGIAVLLGIAGLLPYLYLPLAAAAGAPSVWGDPRTIGGFLAIVGRTAYGTLSLTVRDTSGSALESIGLFAGYLVTAFTPIGLLLAVIGAAWLAIRRTWEAVALGLWVLIAGPVFLAVANPPLTDPVTRGVLERFYILPGLPVAISIGVGVWVAATWLRDRVGARLPDHRVRDGLAPAAVVVTLVALAGLAAVRLPEVDLSKDRVAEAYADDLLGSLPPNALLLMRSDENYTSVTYAQEVRHVRPDVVAVDVELLKLEADVQRLEADHPDIHVPFAAYDGGVRAKLADLVGAVIASRPVFVVGELQENLGTSYDLLDRGLAEQVLAQGSARDPLAALREDPGTFDRLHPPDRTYPDTTWEAAIEAHYADVAFKTGVALQALGPQQNAAEVERFYRAAIKLSPTLTDAYKNLGLLLQTNDGPPDQIIALWQKYLELVPDDPEAAAIRAAIERLRGQPSPSP